MCWFFKSSKNEDAEDHPPQTRSHPQKPHTSGSSKRTKDPKPQVEMPMPNYKRPQAKRPVPNYQRPRAPMPNYQRPQAPIPNYQRPQAPMPSYQRPQALMPNYQRPQAERATAKDQKPKVKGGIKGRYIVNGKTEFSPVVRKK